jgi:hypothetical protein
VYETAPHAVNIECLYFIESSPLEHIDLIIVVGTNNELISDSVYVATGHSIILAVDGGKGIF